MYQNFKGASDPPPADEQKAGHNLERAADSDDKRNLKRLAGTFLVICFTIVFLPYFYAEYTFQKKYSSLMENTAPDSDRTMKSDFLPQNWKRKKLWTTYKMPEEYRRAVLGWQGINFVKDKVVITDETIKDYKSKAENIILILESSDIYLPSHNIPLWKKSLKVLKDSVDLFDYSVKQRNYKSAETFALLSIAFATRAIHSFSHERVYFKFVSLKKSFNCISKLLEVSPRLHNADIFLKYLNCKTAAKELRNAYHHSVIKIGNRFENFDVAYDFYTDLELVLNFKIKQGYADLPYPLKRYLLAFDKAALVNNFTSNEKLFSNLLTCESLSPKNYNVSINKRYFLTEFNEDVYSEKKLYRAFLILVWIDALNLSVKVKKKTQDIKLPPSSVKRTLSQSCHFPEALLITLEGNRINVTLTEAKTNLFKKHGLGKSLPNIFVLCPPKNPQAQENNTVAGQESDTGPYMRLGEHKPDSASR